MNESGYDVEVLGQKFKYPKTWTSSFAVAAIVFAICITICVVSHLYLGIARSQPGTALKMLGFLAGTYERGESDFSTMESYQIQFWTPSTKTWNAIVDANGGKDKVPEEDLWQNVSQERIDGFGKQLKYSGFVDGLRRYHVEGYGEKTFKPGLWWVASSKREINPEDFAKFYLNFWGDSDIVYVEVLTNISKRIAPE